MPVAMFGYTTNPQSVPRFTNKLAKGFVGTNNIESNSRRCVASAGSGYKLSPGANGPTGSYQDIDRADVFFVIGARAGKKAA